VVILRDLNAKSPLWHCPNTDKNGEKFEKLIEQHNLTVINKEGQPPTFRGRAGVESNIDVTLIKGYICNSTFDWIVDEHATTSAHGTVRFIIDMEKNQTNNEQLDLNNKFNYNVNKLNKKTFEESLFLPQIERWQSNRLNKQFRRSHKKCH